MQSWLAPNELDRTRALKMAIARLACRTRWERSIRPTVASRLLKPTPRDCDDHYRRCEAAETDHDGPI